MSDFKAKNLTYDKTQPAFLQRLKAEYAGDRNNVQFARPNKSRLKTGDADEDEPTIVDEAGEGVSKEEYEGMLKRENGGEADAVEGVGVGKDDDKESQEVVNRKGQARDKQKVAEVGVGKKRKAAKVVGNGDEVNNYSETATSAKESKQEDAKKELVSETSSKPKKKSKRIKLSFDDPGD